MTRQRPKERDPRPVRQVFVQVLGQHLNERDKGMLIRSMFVAGCIHRTKCRIERTSSIWDSAETRIPEYQKENDAFGVRNVYKPGVLNNSLIRNSAAIRVLGSGLSVAMSTLAISEAIDERDLCGSERDVPSPTGANRVIDLWRHYSGNLISNP
ncbi:11350_t:CDS:2 [Acaulospora colombiana]|uniref:11350_t:CDS:1 n=1 Tax=Acaulospora colombiana TaxID=27376 RepID=A0ACA9LPN3_9GLOM|nr:11350_t:CDS:2 [Acaulospora colombiana]